MRAYLPRCHLLVSSTYERCVHQGCPAPHLRDGILNLRLASMRYGLTSPSHQPKSSFFRLVDGRAGVARVCECPGSDGQYSREGTPPLGAGQGAMSNGRIGPTACPGGESHTRRLSALRCMKHFPPFSQKKTRSGAEMQGDDNRPTRQSLVQW